MDYAKILFDAHAAAADAVKAEVTARPENPNAFDCGFAWVTLGGNEELSRFCRQHVKKNPGSDKRVWGDKGYPSGWQWWKPGNFHGQSIRIHEVGARAFREALAQHGISATVGSRLD